MNPAGTIDPPEAAPAALDGFEGMPLRVKAVSKSFAGNRVLTDVSLEAVPGEIHLLIGPNGAGKSTLFNVMTGVHRADGGEVRLADARIDRLRTVQVARRGVSRTFQNLQLFSDLTVLENLLVAEHASRRRAVRRRSRDGQAMLRDLIDGLGLGAVADKRPADLSFGERRFVEIARALASRPRVLLMDEPAAGLSFGDRARLKEMLRQVRASGVTTVLVEHDMRFAMSLGDTATVLAAGRCIFQGTPADAQRSEEVRREYLG